MKFMTRRNFGEEDFPPSFAWTRFPNDFTIFRVFFRPDSEPGPWPELVPGPSWGSPLKSWAPAGGLHGNP